MDRRILNYILVFIAIIVLYFTGKGIIFVQEKDLIFIAIILVSLTISYFIQKARSGEDIYLRPLSALKAIEEAIGRATEMGKSVLFVPGISDMDQVETVSGMVVLGHVAGMTAN